MSKSTDARPVAAALYLLPIATRVPLKFGAETLTSVTCARVGLTVEGMDSRRAEGWGETPLSVQWAWPSALPHEERHRALVDFCMEQAEAWPRFEAAGHPLEVGHDFQKQRLADLLEAFNARRRGSEPMPWLAALVSCSAFDLALHDAFGKLNGLPVYETYNGRYMSRDLASYLTPAEGSEVSFAGKYPEEFLAFPRPRELPAWHLVGGKDPLASAELTGGEPRDGYPVLLSDWIRRDGLRCLKVKLRGDDAAWDYGRLVSAGRIAVEEGARWLSADFNCTVTDPAYVNAILDRLLEEEPRLHGMLLYVEQPFPYDLERFRIDVRSVSARKPLFMDESAHDWQRIRLGRSLGWTGVALKTCKTQTGALLSLSWAKAHGMTLMVQDLTNPMLAQIPHVLLAAHAGTIMGVETNAMQFYPEASAPEAKIHPGIYRRRGGKVDLSSIRGPGFGYRLEEIERELPAPVKRVATRA
ncbi:MAG: mandelate racemase/muconate lactonizing enzyme family protein [Planctomycetes bacterium]|nr:mandelate racemase/muconate lactonizing enzyme family protein [Planctomycetota bacterium]